MTNQVFKTSKRSDFRFDTDKNGSNVMRVKLPFDPNQNGRNWATHREQSGSNNKNSMFMNTGRDLKSSKDN